VSRRKPPTTPKPSTEKADEIGPTTSTEPDESDGLEPLQLRFIDLSASGTGMEEAARELGVCSRTLRRWKLRPQVATAIRNRTAESMALARAVLTAGANRAARELVDLAETAEPDHARIAACVAVVSNATKLTEFSDLQTDLAEIRERLAAMPGNQPTTFGRRF
jgi:transposase-like protein